MTDMNATTMDFASDIARTTPFEVEDIFWGYKVRSGNSAPFAVMFGQAVCFLRRLFYCTPLIESRSESKK